MKNIFGAVIVLVGFLVFSGVSWGDGGSSASRTVPDFVDPGDEFQIVINVDNPPEAYVLYERIQPGLSLVSAEPMYANYNEDNGQITWVFTPGGVHTYTYTLISHEPGTYALNGNVVVTDEVSFALEGDIEVKVWDNCTGNWTCGYWSDCVDNEQTRSCRDLNGCLFRVNMPVTKQSCTVDESEQASDDQQESADEADVAVDIVEEDTGDDVVVDIAEADTGSVVVESAEVDSGYVPEVETVADDEDTGAEESTDDAEEIVRGEMITGDAIAAGDETGTEGDVVSDEDMSGADESTVDSGMPLFTRVLGFILLAEILLLIVRTKRK